MNHQIEYSIKVLGLAIGTEIKWYNVANRKTYKGLLLSIDYDTMWLVVKEIEGHAVPYYVDSSLVTEVPFIDKMIDTKLFKLAVSL